MVHRQLVAELARHVLHAQPRSDDASCPIDDEPEPAVLHGAGAGHRPGVHAGVGHAGQRLRRTLQAHDRAVPQRSADLGDRPASIRSSSIDGIDRIVGGTTSVTYGLNNRFYAKRKRRDSSARRRRSSASRSSRPTTPTHAPRSTIRATPRATSQRDAEQLLADLAGRPGHADGESQRDGPGRIDSHYRSCERCRRTPTTTGRAHLQTSGRLEPEVLHRGLPDFNDPTCSITTSTSPPTCTRATTSTASNYSFNYDILRSRLLQQRISAFYNAQCCGLAFEYQRYNFAGVQTLLVPSDHRFFLSFTLAGLGNFSPFNGGLSGVPR